MCFINAVHQLKSLNWKHTHTHTLARSLAWVQNAHCSTVGDYFFLTCTIVIVVVRAFEILFRFFFACVCIDCAVKPATIQDPRCNPVRCVCPMTVECSFSVRSILNLTMNLMEHTWNGKKNTDTSGTKQVERARQRGKMKCLSNIFGIGKMLDASNFVKVHSPHSGSDQATSLEVTQMTFSSFLSTMLVYCSLPPPPSTSCIVQSLSGFLWNKFSARIVVGHLCWIFNTRVKLNLTICGCVVEDKQKNRRQDRLMLSLSGICSVRFWI